MNVIDSPTPARKEAGFNYRKLTREEEYQYFKEYRNGDQEAFEILIQSQLPYARLLASRIHILEKHRDDLTQVAFLGVIKAVKTFKTEKGNRLSTYTTQAVRNSLFDYVHTRLDIIKYPSYLFNKGSKGSKGFTRHVIVDLGPDSKALGYTVEFDGSDLPVEIDLSILTDRERDVLYKRYVRGLTLKETSKYYNCTRENIRQIQVKALKKLRNVYCKNKT